MNNSALVDGPTQLKIVLSALLLSFLLVSAVGNASQVCARSAIREAAQIQPPIPKTAAGPSDHIIR
jgi:hypothetical protein